MAYSGFSARCWLRSYSLLPRLFATLLARYTVNTSAPSCGSDSHLVHPSDLVCSFCSYSRNSPSNFLSHGSLPPRSCLSAAPRCFALRAATLWQANPPYSRRGPCSSGLSFRIITVPCGLSPQFAYRVARTEKSLPEHYTQGGIFFIQG